MTTLDTYHERSEFSSSQIPKFLDDPIHWYHTEIKKDWPKDPPTPAMKFGTAVHAMIELGGPEHVCKTIPQSVLNEDGHCKGKAWTDWKKSNPAGDYVKEGEQNALAIIWEHLHANPVTRDLLACPRKEYQIIWQHKPTGLACRTMIDVMTDGWIVDWKTSTTNNARKFQTAICEMGYDLRLAFYQRAVESETGEIWPVLPIAIHNTGGFGVHPYDISEDWMAEARDELERVLADVVSFDIQSEMNRQITTIHKPGWRFSRRYEVEV